jgi:serine/threonine protein kinase
VCRHCFCRQGSLRDALDCGLLAKPGSFLAPSAVLALAHDVAAAMLHLHSEGIVHGDLKAGNVMLTSSSVGSLGSPPSISMWASSGQRPLTAKVADFGLALPLGPADTHATLLARVSRAVALPADTARQQRQRWHSTVMCVQSTSLSQSSMCDVC